MPQDFMAPYRVGRTGNAELDDALARIEDMRQSLDRAACALEDGRRFDLAAEVEDADAALTDLAKAILA